MLSKIRKKAKMSLPTNSIQNCADISSLGNKEKDIKDIRLERKQKNCLY